MRMLAEPPVTFQNLLQLRTETFQNCPERKLGRESSPPKVTQKASDKTKATRNLETNSRILHRQETFPECKCSMRFQFPP